jgi:DNA polymerase III subunit beta
MSVTVSTKDLREALVIVGNSMARRPNIMIQESVMLSAINGQLELKTSDLQHYGKVTIPCEGDSIKACVNFKTISQFVNKGNGKVKLSLDKRAVVAERNDIGKLKMDTTNYKTDDFVSFPSSESLNWKTFDAKDICRSFMLSFGACAREESRPVLTALDFRDGALASADGFRLYCMKSDKLQFGLDGKEALVEWTTIQKVIRIFGKCDKLDIAFNADRTTGYFKSGETILISHLVQGQFPKYEQLFPTAYNTKVKFSSPLMSDRLEAIDKNTIHSGILRLIFSQDEQKQDICQLQAGMEEMGEYELSLPVKVETPMFGRIAVNIQYIKEAIKPFSMVSMELTSESQPLKITGDIEGLTLVVMPMFVQW